MNPEVKGADQNDATRKAQEELKTAEETSAVLGEMASDLSNVEAQLPGAQVESQPADVNALNEVGDKTDAKIQETKKKLIEQLRDLGTSKRDITTEKAQEIIGLSERQNASALELLNMLGFQEPPSPRQMIDVINERLLDDSGDVKLGDTGLDLDSPADTVSDLKMQGGEVEEQARANVDQLLSEKGVSPVNEGRQKTSEAEDIIPVAQEAEPLPENLEARNLEMEENLAKRRIKIDEAIENDASKEELVDLIRDLPPEQQERLAEYIKTFRRARKKNKEILGANQDAKSIIESLTGQEIEVMPDDVEFGMGSNAVVLQVNTEVFKKVRGESTDQEVVVDDHVVSVVKNGVGDSKGIRYILVNKEHEAIIEKKRYVVQQLIEHEQDHVAWYFLESTDENMASQKLTQEEREVLQNGKTLKSYLVREKENALYRAQDEIIASFRSRPSDRIAPKFKSEIYNYFNELDAFLQERPKDHAFAKKVGDMKEEYFEIVQKAISAFDRLMVVGGYDTTMTRMLLTNEYVPLDGWDKKVDTLLASKINKHKEGRDEEFALKTRRGTPTANRDFLEKEILMAEMAIENLRDKEGQEKKLVTYELRQEVLLEKWDQLKEQTTENIGKRSERISQESIDVVVEKRQKEERCQSLIEKLQETADLCNGFAEEFKGKKILYKKDGITAGAHFKNLAQKNSNDIEVFNGIKEKKITLSVGELEQWVDKKIENLGKNQSYYKSLAEKSRKLAKEIEAREKERDAKGKEAYDARMKEDITEEILSKQQDSAVLEYYGRKEGTDGMHDEEVREEILRSANSNIEGIQAKFGLSPEAVITLFKEGIDVESLNMKKAGLFGLWGKKEVTAGEAKWTEEDFKKFVDGKTKAVQINIERLVKERLKKGWEDEKIKIASVKKAHVYESERKKHETKVNNFQDLYDVWKIWKQEGKLTPSEWENLMALNERIELFRKDIKGAIASRRTDTTERIDRFVASLPGKRGTKKAVDTLLRRETIKLLKGK